jgi:peptide/nickel transport system permease protein
MAILAEAGLSFLGIGIKPPTAAWGSMVSDGYKYLLSNPVLSLAPGIAIMLVVFAFNMVGDGLRDALDPRLRGII